jgi:hypothetical protein
VADRRAAAPGGHRHAGPAADVERPADVDARPGDGPARLRAHGRPGVPPALSPRPCRLRPGAEQRAGGPRPRGHRRGPGPRPHRDGAPVAGRRGDRGRPGRAPRPARDQPRRRPHAQDADGPLPRRRRRSAQARGGPRPGRASARPLGRLRLRGAVQHDGAHARVARAGAPGAPRPGSQQGAARVRRGAAGRRRRARGQGPPAPSRGAADAGVGRGRAHAQRQRELAGREHGPLRAPRARRGARRRGPTFVPGDPPASTSTGATARHCRPASSAIAPAAPRSASRRSSAAR